MCCECSAVAPTGQSCQHKYLNIGRKLRIIEVRVAINQTQISALRRFSVHDHVATHNDCCSGANSALYFAHGSGYCTGTRNDFDARVF
jgi:hypothetical protein